MAKPDRGILAGLSDLLRSLLTRQGHTVTVLRLVSSSRLHRPQHPRTTRHQAVAVLRIEVDPSRAIGLDQVTASQLSQEPAHWPRRRRALGQMGAREQNVMASSCQGHVGQATFLRDAVAPQRQAVLIQQVLDLVLVHLRRLKDTQSERWQGGSVHPQRVRELIGRAHPGLRAHGEVLTRQRGVERETLLIHADRRHVVPLQPLGGVNRHELDRARLGLDLRGRQGTLVSLCRVQPL